MVQSPQHFCVPVALYWNFAITQFYLSFYTWLQLSSLFSSKKLSSSISSNIWPRSPSFITLIKLSGDLVRICCIISIFHVQINSHFVQRQCQKQCLVLHSQSLLCCFCARKSSSILADFIKFDKPLLMSTGTTTH